MKPAYEKEIKQIMGEFNCPKDFICYKSGFSNLCEAEDIGLEPFLECLEKSPEECPFVLSYANVHFCDCRLRCYIAKKLRK
jgi:hypothetical protein